LKNNTWQIRIEWLNQKQIKLFIKEKGAKIEFKRIRTETKIQKIKMTKLCFLKKKRKEKKKKAHHWQIIPSTLTNTSTRRKENDITFNDSLKGQVCH